MCAICTRDVCAYLCVIARSVYVMCTRVRLPVRHVPERVRPPLRHSAECVHASARPSACPRLRPYVWASVRTSGRVRE